MQVQSHVHNYKSTTENQICDVMFCFYYWMIVVPFQTMFLMQTTETSV